MSDLSLLPMEKTEYMVTSLEHAVHVGAIQRTVQKRMHYGQEI